MIRFWVNGVPKAQPRPRLNTRTRHVYNPPSADAWKEQVMWHARAARIPKMSGPIQVTLSFALGGKESLNGRPHSSKPDSDNLMKAILDSLTTIGAWGDDSQVFDCRVIKRYGNPSGVLVTLEEVYV